MEQSLKDVSLWAIKQNVQGIEASKTLYFLRYDNAYNYYEKHDYCSEPYCVKDVAEKQRWLREGKTEDFDEIRKSSSQNRKPFFNQLLPNLIEVI